MVRRKVCITVCPGEGRRALVRRLRTVGLEQESDNLVFRQPPLASDLQAGVRLSTLPPLRIGGVGHGGLRLLNLAHPVRLRDTPFLFWDEQLSRSAY